MHEHTSRTPKATLPSPGAQHHFRFKPGISDVAYPDLEELFADLAQIYREELSELAALGATYVQLDDVAFALMCDPEHRAEVRPAAPTRTSWSPATCSSRTTRSPAAPTR